MGWRARFGAASTLCNDTERLLRSGRTELGSGPAVALLPGSGHRRSKQALGDASRHLGDAQRLLAPYRDHADTAWGQAYAAIHLAKGDVASALCWQALEERLWGTTGDRSRQ